MEELEAYIAENMDKITWTVQTSGTGDGVLGPYTLRLRGDVVLIADTERTLVWARIRNPDLVDEIWDSINEWSVHDLVRLLPTDGRQNKKQ